MAQDIELRIKAIVESADASKNIDELKDSLKELESIAENVDLSPDQLNQLGGAIDNLTNKVQTSEASLENFDRGVKTVKASGDLLAGSIATVVGGLATLGIENEYVTNLTQGAAGAIALSSGVAQAGDAIVKLSQNTKIATVAQRAFNIVANLNPYLLAATALLATGAAILAIASSLDDSTKAQEISNETTQRAIDLRRQQIDVEESLAKVLAANTRERLTAELNATNARLQILEEEAKFIVENATTIEDASERIDKVEDERTKLRIARIGIEQNLQRENIRLELEEFEQREKLLAVQGASEEQLFNARVATLNKTIELFGAESDEGIRAARELAVVRAQFATDTAAKRTEASTKATEKEIEDEEKLKEKIKQNEESISEFLRKSRIGRELDRKEDADREIAELELEFTEQIKLAGDNNELKLQLEQEFINRKKEIEKKAADEQKVKDDADAADKLLTEQATNDALLASRLDLADASSAALGQLSNLLKQGTAAQKAAALAEIAINTGIGFVQGLDIAQKSAKATGPAAALAFPIFYASQIAAVLGAASRARSILQVVPGGGDGPQPSVGGFGGGGIGGGAVSAPTFSPQQFFGLGQGNVIPGGGQPQDTKVFVVESDITNVQNKVNVIEERSRI